MLQQPPSTRREPAQSPPEPDWSLEEKLWRLGFSPVAGVDEAGRGALAGPVVAAAVVLPRGSHPYRDSKTLNARRREELAQRVREEAIGWAVGVAEPEEVDRLNVLKATHLAAERALAELSRQARPAALVTDYLWLKGRGRVLAVPRADCHSYQAAAASILAKVTRDELMCRLAETHPEYDFASNKGYGAPRHLEALERQGPCAAHRMSFAPLTRFAPGLFVE